MKMVSLFAFLSASLLIAQPQLGSANLTGGWLWPKGVYTLAIHDGPGPRTEDIATFLAANGMVADFFQTLCHYTGQPWADQRSAMCFQQHQVPVASLTRLINQHQCVGNHGQDHLNTTTLNQADTVYQIGGPTTFLKPYGEQQNCPALVTFPGFQTDLTHIGWLNQDAITTGRQQGPVGADLTGSGTLQTSMGAVAIGSDQDCFAKGYSQQQCLGLMLGAMAQSNSGGVIAIHDFDPFAKIPMDPTDLKSAYTYDYLVGIVNGCQATNGGVPCVWLTPDAIPGVRRGLAVTQFSQVSNSSDDFSNRIAGVVMGDINGDGFPDVLLPRTDGLYCAINAGNGTVYPLQRCLSFSDSSMVASRYWLVDVEGDRLPYLVWLNSNGLAGVKVDGHGGFRSSVKVIAESFSASKLQGNIVYPESIRFGDVRSGSSLPDVVAMSSLGVVIADNNGTRFGAVHLVPHLSYPAAGTALWNPQEAAANLALVDLFGTGALDIVIPGTAGLLYSTPVKNTFSPFKALAARDGFNYWSSPLFYTMLSATRIGGRNAIAGWTPVGLAFSNFTAVDRRALVDQFQVLCNDCFVSLPDWLRQWQASNMTTAPFQTGFADFKNTGSPQAFAVWGKGLYASDIATLAGYR